MWGREMRAGLVFVLVSLAAGSAVRGYRRGHETRFQELVERLEEGEMTRLERHALAQADTGSVGAATARGPGGTDADRAGGGPAPRDARPPSLRAASIDVDRADVAAFVRLPGIGPALAARIVADRAVHGPFGSPEGLLRVHGIGPKTLGRIRGYLAAPPRPDSGGASGPSPLAP